MVIGNNDVTSFNQPYWQFNYDAPLIKEYNVFNCPSRFDIIKNVRTIYKTSDTRLLTLDACVT